MKFKAIARYAKITPKKARRIIRIIQGKKINEAMGILEYLPHSASYFISKVLKSAIDNARYMLGQKNINFIENNFIVTEAYVDQGPKTKRFKPRAQGRMCTIEKKTSHLTVVINQK